MPVATQKLLRRVISFKNNAVIAYSTGLTQSTDPLPAGMQTALMFEIKPATEGVEADAPEVL